MSRPAPVAIAMEHKMEEPVRMGGSHTKMGGHGMMVGGAGSVHP